MTGAVSRRGCLAPLAAAHMPDVIEQDWRQGGLAGSLARPAANRSPRPAVLVIAGSGPTDRAGNIAVYGDRAARFDPALAPAILGFLAPLP